MSRASVLVAAAAVVVSACSAAPAGTPIIVYVTPSPGASGSSAAATASVATATASQASQTTPATATATPKPTPRPTRTPTPTSAAGKGDPVLVVDKDSIGYVTAQVIMEVQNQGPTWIEISAFSSSFTIFAPDGSVTATDSFDAEAPAYLGPGQSGYLVGQEFGNDFPVSAYDRVEHSVAA